MEDKSTQSTRSAQGDAEWRTELSGPKPVLPPFIGTIDVKAIIKKYAFPMSFSQYKVCTCHEHDSYILRYDDSGTSNIWKHGQREGGRGGAKNEKGKRTCFQYYEK